MREITLKQQILNIIAFHFDRELWQSRPEQSYDEAIAPFVESLAKLATNHKRGQHTRTLSYDESDICIITESAETIGDRIRELRASKGWTLEQFAEKTNLNSEYLRCIERGEPILRLWALEQILDVLQVKSSAVLPF